MEIIVFTIEDAERSRADLKRKLVVCVFPVSTVWFYMSREFHDQKVAT